MLRLHIEKDGDTIVSSGLTDEQCLAILQIVLKSPASQPAKQVRYYPETVDGVYTCIGVYNVPWAIQLFNMIGLCSDFSMNALEELLLGIHTENPWKWDSKRQVFGDPKDQKELDRLWRGAFHWFGDIPEPPQLQRRQPHVFLCVGVVPGQERRAAKVVQTLLNMTQTGANLFLKNISDKNPWVWPETQPFFIHEEDKRIILAGLDAFIWNEGKGPTEINGADGEYKCVGVNDNRKIHAIKILRILYGWGLKDAKDFVEAISENNPWIWVPRAYVLFLSEPNQEYIAKNWDNTFVWQGNVAPRPVPCPRV